MKGSSLRHRPLSKAQAPITLGGHHRLGLAALAGAVASISRCRAPRHNPNDSSFSIFSRVIDLPHRRILLPDWPNHWIRDHAIFTAPSGHLRGLGIRTTIARIQEPIAPQREGANVSC